MLFFSPKSSRLKRFFNRATLGKFVAIVILVALTVIYMKVGNPNNFNTSAKIKQSDVLSPGKLKKTLSPTATPTVSPTTAPSPTPTVMPNSPTPTSTPQPASSPTPTISTGDTGTSITTSPVSFGVVVDDYANRSGGISAVESRIGRNISAVSIFKQFGSNYNKTFNPDDLTYAKSKNAKVYVAWEPWNPDQGMSQSVDYLKEIPQGKHDEYMKSFAASIKSYGAPVIIRFGHEMNGNWYPWGNRPAEYVTAYRYTVNLFKNEGVSNVKWMWAINANNVPDAPISTVANFYPGEDTVDTIGIDGYNFGDASHGGWRSFKEVFIESYTYLTTHYSKPIVIAETASAEAGGNKPEWVNNMFKVELPTFFSKVNEIIWFDLLKEQDWRINSSDSTLQSFKLNLQSSS